MCISIIVHPSLLCGELRSHLAHFKNSMLLQVAGRPLRLGPCEGARRYAAVVPSRWRIDFSTLFSSRKSVSSDTVTVAPAPFC